MQNSISCRHKVTQWEEKGNYDVGYVHTRRVYATAHSSSLLIPREHLMTDLQAHWVKKIVRTEGVHGEMSYKLMLTLPSTSAECVASLVLVCVPLDTVLSNGPFLLPADRSPFTLPEVGSALSDVGSALSDAGSVVSESVVGLNGNELWNKTTIW
jgi:hypothetical protein